MCIRKKSSGGEAGLDDARSSERLRFTSIDIAECLHPILVAVSAAAYGRDAVMIALHPADLALMVGA